MADKTAKAEKDIEPVSMREEFEKKLLQTLTPAGKRFARRLDESLADEFTLLSCDAADLIREHVEEHHLKTTESIKAINNLALHRTKPRVTAYYLIMNHANLLLTSGRVHRAQGVLNEKGEQLFEVWTIYAHRLVDLGMEPYANIEEGRRKLMAAIRTKGKGGSLTLSGVVKSWFKKKRS